MRAIANVPEEDRPTDMGNMHKKIVKIARVVPEISCLTDIQTHRHTSRQTHSSQYLATALAGEVITCLKTLLKRSQGRAIANFDWDFIPC